MGDQHFERVADPAELAAVAADLLQHLLLDLRMRRLAEVDVDKAELRPLLVEGPGIDRLPQFIGRKRELERLGHDGLRTDGTTPILSRAQFRRRYCVDMAFGT
ncbi:MAG TPA: hypothetical protein VMS43_17345 [Allosphingosinicella sp.]|nr:hypothetical protein [Allosphingosinicella sp.]